jgi:hypothetical protein
LVGSELPLIEKVMYLSGERTLLLGRTLPLIREGYELGMAPNACHQRTRATDAV